MTSYGSEGNRFENIRVALSTDHPNLIVVVPDEDLKAREELMTILGLGVWSWSAALARVRQLGGGE